MKKIVFFNTLPFIFITVTAVICFSFAACKDGSTSDLPPKPVVSSVTVIGSGVIQKGGLEIFTASVIGTHLLSEHQKVIWSIDEANKKDGTFIVSTGSTTGRLTIADDENLDTLTVKAVSVLDDSKFDSVSVTVSNRESSNNTDTSMLTLSAVTNRPNISLYIQNSADNDFIELTVTGINGYSGASLWLDYKIIDIFNTMIAQGSLEFLRSQGNTQRKQVPIDKSKLGHFTFIPSIPGGAPPIPAIGSRGAGFITYAVLVDPALRRKNPPYGHPDVDKYLYFGMFLIPWSEYNGFDLFEVLGMDNAIGGLNWNEFTLCTHGWRCTHLTGCGTSTAKIESYDNPFIFRSPYKIIGDLTSYMPLWARTEAGQPGIYGGELSEYGEQEFIKYIEELAKLYIERAPLRPHHYYQILWEPVDYWNGWAPMGNWVDYNPEVLTFDPPRLPAGGDVALVRIHELAYKTIHEVYNQKAIATGDSNWRKKAVVLGPTFSSLGTGYWDGLYWHNNLFKLGLAEYIDGFSIHPYDSGQNSQTGEDGSVGSGDDLVIAYRVKDLVTMVKSYYANRKAAKFYDQPFFWGTEQGMKEVNLDGSRRPFLIAQLVTRQNIIMKGEGFDANIMFCFADYDDGFYGFFYNLTRMSNDTERHVPDSVSPKPALPALAAMSWLLKGYKTEGMIRQVGSNLCYKFKDTESSSVIYAVWNYMGSSAINLNVGANSVIVYDIAGNAESRSSPGGILNITLTEYVQYVKVN